MYFFTLALLYFAAAAPSARAAATGCTYPTSLDTFSNVLTGQTLSSSLYNKLQCAIEKLESDLAFPRYTVATRPAAPVEGQVIRITDGADATDCDTGGGSTQVSCEYKSAAWVSIGSGAGVQLSDSPTWTGVHRFTGANSFANSVRIGDGTDFWAVYDHASNGLQFNCAPGGVENDCHYLRDPASGKKWGALDAFEYTKGTGITRLFPGTQTSEDCVYYNGTIWTKLANCRTSGFTYTIDRAAGLLDTDDRNKFLRIPYAQTITQICGTTDTGTSTINIQRDDGSSANILSSNMVAASTEVCSTTFVSGENVLSEGHYLHFVMVDADTSGAPTKLTISFKTTRTP